MTDVGDLSKFGFRIGPPNEDSRIREVAIFINGENVAADTIAFLPSYVEGLRSQSFILKNRLNFEEYVGVFRSHNLTEIHNFLQHGDPRIIESDREWWFARDYHRFMNLNEPNTDSFVAFLIAGDDGLYLTYEIRDALKGKYERSDIVKGVGGLLPYELIRTIDTAVELLENKKDQSVSE